MYRLHEITTVHLEISSLCNARCPMCLRNVSGGKTNPRLPLTDLRIEQIEKIFSPEFLRQLRRIYLCGNYGDPSLGRDTVRAYRYFREANPAIRLGIFSNGSARDEAWWEELASLGVDAHFGIDGIGETNSIYRRGTNFDSIVRNARAFIAAGGKAHWDFIVFRHNEHEIEAARRFAQELGFESFRPKKTGRFFSNQLGQFKDRQAVLNEAGEVEYYLETPRDAAYLNPSLQRESALAERFGSFESYLDRTPVACKVAAEKSFYVSAEGLVFPCCWTAIQLYPWYQKEGSSQVERILREIPGGRDSINALKTPLSDILDGPFFQRAVPESWGLSSVKEGKLKVCARICGKDFDPFRDQFTQ
jgi:MoaA/NifB/PqqE/SkfB family radical SAM enzyme